MILKGLHMEDKQEALIQMRLKKIMTLKKIDNQYQLILNIVNNFYE